VLSVTYRIAADLDCLRIPGPAEARAAEPLWQHTCCEIFIRRETADAYHEFNFSPSGAWTAYAFERYRQGGPLVDPALDPAIAVRMAEGELSLEACVRLDRLSERHAHAALQLALSAVIEDREGVLSYWALRHAEGKPDFHDARAFALALAAERSGGESARR
jgi:hypothetical protein